MGGSKAFAKSRLLIRSLDTASAAAASFGAPAAVKLAAPDDAAPPLLLLEEIEWTAAGSNWHTLSRWSKAPFASRRRRDRSCGEVIGPMRQHAAPRLSTSLATKIVDTAPSS